jgi:hypothetical protein
MSSGYRSFNVEKDFAWRMMNGTGVGIVFRRRLILAFGTGCSYTKFSCTRAR